ncbi:MAG: HAD-IA family hydrolase [Pseudomonadota bacterium]
MSISNPKAVAIQAVIFDCDGTLVDSETSGMTALHGEATKLGFSIPLAQALHDFRGKRMAVCIAMVEANIGRPVPENFESTVRQAMADSFRSGVVAMPGALDLLDLLKQAGIPYAIASNGPQAKMQLTLGLTGLQPYFEQHVFSAYDVGHWKPAPELFLQAANALGVVPENCAVVEDSLPGIEAGLAAGMTVFSMCHTETIPDHIASRIVQIEGLGDLPLALGLAA